jgi:hypothetical protein
VPLPEELPKNRSGLRFVNIDTGQGKARRVHMPVYAMYRLYNQYRITLWSCDFVPLICRCLSG